ncbi:hypothetical protein ACLKA7_011410 [Drosophila subpalustris]
MPKKVITRRQRKAAEAKRKFQQIDDTPLETLDANRDALGSSEEPEVKAEQQVSGADAEPADKERNKATVRIIVNDKNIKPDKKVFDLLVDENNKNNKGGLPSVPGPQIEQGSFSKTLTRRAAATITKIQKLSKAFNKKISYKQSAAQVESIQGARNNPDETAKSDFVGPSKDQDKPCNCDFCKVVLSQLLARKKRANEKKNCKNSRRLGNSPEQLDDVVNCEDCRMQTHKQRFLQLMEMNQREREMQRIKNLNKTQSNKIVKPNKCETKPISNNDTKKSEIKKPSIGVQSRPSFKTEGKKILMKPSSKTFSEPKSKSKENFLSVMQQMAMEPKVNDRPPVKVFGNTGYFVLTGTDAQLSAQIRDLQAKNVLIQRCIVLKKGVHDKADQQLDKLNQNREELLRKMRDKHEMLEPRRQERQKKQRKYP